MPTPPTLTGPVTLALCPVDYSIYAKDPVTLNGDVNGGWKATVTFVVNAWDMYRFASFCGGQLYSVSGGAATRIVPLSYPDDQYLLCSNIECVGKGQYTPPDVYPANTGRTATLSNHSVALVKVTFSSVPYLTDGSAPFLVKETEGAGQQVSIAGTKFVFPSDGTPVPEDASVRVPVVVYRLTVFLAASLNDSVLNPLLGCVNSSAFLGLATGTVRFDSYSSSLNASTGGQQSYTRSIVLSWRPVVWNNFLRPNGVWEVLQNPAGNPVYTPADLSPLVA